MSSGSNTNTVQQSDPWSVQQPYLQHGMDAANQIYNRNVGVPLPAQSPFTQQANQMLAQRGAQGSPLISSAQNNLTDTLNGKYLDPSSNPYLSGAVNDALGQARSAFTGMYGGANGNNINNSGFQEGLTRTLANTALPMYANAYQSGRQNQMQAAQLAPNVASQDLLNIGALQSAGQNTDLYNQAAANQPWNNLAKYGQAVTGNYGSVNQGQMFSNPMAQAMGMGLGGLALYNAGTGAGLWGGGAAAGGAGSWGAGDTMGTMAAFA